MVKTMHALSVLIALLLISCLTRLGAVEVTLKVPSQVLPGVSFNAELHVTNPEKNLTSLDLPQQAGISIERSARGVGQRSVTVNGVHNYTIVIHLSVTVAEQGPVTIPSVGIKFEDGSLARSEPVATVSKPGDERLTDFFFAEVTFEPSQVVPGQQTAMRLHLYSLQEASALIDQPGVQPPAEATSVRKLEADTEFVYGAGGRRYRHQTHTWLMSFTKPGTHDVSGQQTFYRKKFFGAERLGIQPVKGGRVTVLAFPQEDRPADFQGLIGPLQVEMKLARDLVALGEGTSLELDVTGMQLAGLARPDLKPLPGYRLHELDVIDIDGGRRFTWNVEPVQKGTMQMPEVSIAWYDPRKQQYDRVQLEGPRLEVLAGRSQSLQIGGVQTPQLRETNTALTTTAALSRVMPEPLRRAGGPSWQWWFIPMAGFCAFVIGFLMTSQRVQSDKPRKSTAGKELRQALAQSDWDAANRILQREVSQLQGEDAALCRRCIAGIENARFGGGAVEESLIADLKILGRVL